MPSVINPDGTKRWILEVVAGTVDADLMAITEVVAIHGFSASGKAAVVCSHASDFKIKVEANRKVNLAVEDHQDGPDEFATLAASPPPPPPPALSQTIGRPSYQDFNAFDNNLQWPLQQIGAAKVTANKHDWDLNQAASDPHEGSGGVVCCIGFGLPSYRGPLGVLEPHPMFEAYPGPVVASGTGDSVSAPAGTNTDEVTVTDAAGAFTALMVGSLLEVTGAGNGGNNGKFPVLDFIDANNIVIRNVAGVVETSAFSWNCRPKLDIDSPAVVTSYTGSVLDAMAADNVFDGEGPTRGVDAGDVHDDGGVLGWSMFHDLRSLPQPTQRFILESSGGFNPSGTIGGAGAVSSRGVGSESVPGSAFNGRSPRFGSALTGTWTWAGTEGGASDIAVAGVDATTVLSPGDFIRSDADYGTDPFLWLVDSVTASAVGIVGTATPIPSGVKATSRLVGTEARHSDPSSWLRGRMRGMAPRCKHIFIRINGAFSFGGYLLALQRAQQFGAHATWVSFSFGAGVPPNLMAQLRKIAQNELDDAADNGMLVCQAWHHNGEDFTSDPNSLFPFLGNPRHISAGQCAPRDWNPADADISQWDPAGHADPRPKAKNLDRMVVQDAPVFGQSNPVFIFGGGVSPDQRVNASGPGGSSPSLYADPDLETTEADNAFYSTTTIDGRLGSLLDGLFPDQFQGHGPTTINEGVTCGTFAAVAALCQEAAKRSPSAAYLTHAQLHGVIMETLAGKVGPERDWVRMGALEDSPGDWAPLFSGDNKDTFVAGAKHRSMTLIHNARGGMFQPSGIPGAFSFGIGTQTPDGRLNHRVQDDDRLMEKSGQDNYYGKGRLDAAAAVAAAKLE